MKKIICLLLVCCIACLSVGCSSEERLPASSSKSVSQVTNQQESGPQLELLSPIDYKEVSGVSSGDGYYEVAYTASGYNLKYTDYASKQRIYLCNRPECTHSDETCASWFENNAQTLWIGNSLYLYVWPVVWEEKSGYIEKRNIDGTDPKTIYTLSASEGGEI